MEEFLEFTTTLDDVSVASPKRGYSLSVVRESVWRVDVGNASVRQTSEEVACDVLEVSGYTPASRTVQMYLDTATGRGNKLYKVAFSVVGVSALTVTFSTGLDNRESATVPVPTSSSLQVPGKYSLFDLYVDALGNVSAGGLGAGIIEHESNAYGEYIKYGDGTLTCMGTRITSSLAARSDSFFEDTFPHAFVGAVPFMPAPSLSAGSAGGGAFANIYSVSNDHFHTVVRAHSSAAQAYQYYWIAIGRWK